MVKCGLEEEDAKDRSRWRNAVRKGTEKLKQDMIEERREKRLRRKNPAMAALTGSTCHLCAGHAKEMLEYKPTFDSAADEPLPTRLWQNDLASSTGNLGCQIYGLNLI